MKSKKKNQKKLPWTSDLREIEKRMIDNGLINKQGGLIWDKASIRKKLKP